MKNALIATTAALVVHAFLAVAIVACLNYAPEPDVLVSLDLSRVELSFAKKDDDAPVVSPMPPSPPSVAEPRPEARPPEPPRAEVRPLPPDPDSLGVKPPDGDVAPMEEMRDDKRENREDPKPQTESAAVPLAAPKQASIDVPPRPRKTIRPRYPDGARQRREQGNVELEIRVEDDGSVGEVRVVSSSGFVELDDAAVRAARAARFSPAKSGGSAVASTARLTLTFRLRD